jgi:FkbM family methyltransferase
VGAEGSVVGFEPQPTTVARALQNLKLNGISGQVRIVLSALGEEPGVVALAPPPIDNAGAASLLDEGAGRAGDSPCTALMLPLDDLRIRLGLGPIRLLLLDVQGYEPRILAGLRREPLPEIVVVEANRSYLARDGSDVGRLVAVLRGLGYEIFDLHGRPSDGTTPPPEVNLIGVQPSHRVCWLPVPR